MINESGYHVKGVKFVSRLLIGLLFVSIAEVEDAGLEKNCIHRYSNFKLDNELLKGLDQGDTWLAVLATYSTTEQEASQAGRE